TGIDWYIEESRATHRLNVAQEDICLSASRLPSVHEMRRLIEVLDHTTYPVLLHCKRGADRTGLVSTVVLLLQTDVSLTEASRQLGLRYGHVALGKTTYLNVFLDLYQEWLCQQGLHHSRDIFRHWLECDYCPAECRCAVEALEVPARVPRGQPFAV